MTPLQKAAQQALEAITIASLRCVSEAETCKVLAANVALRKALAAEQAQAVEPAAWISITQHGSTTTIDNTFNDCVSNWPVGEYKLYTHPAPPPASKHVPETAFGNISRDTLIKRLRRKADAWDYLQPGATRLNACRQAADMLKADAREIEATERQVEILSDELSKCSKAQQVAVPMSEQDIMDATRDMCREFRWPSTPIEITRAIEAHHKITAKPSHTDWSAA